MSLTCSFQSICNFLKLRHSSSRVQQREIFMNSDRNIKDKNVIKRVKSLSIMSETHVCLSSLSETV
jgi:hypothetical protein